MGRRVLFRAIAVVVLIIGLAFSLPKAKTNAAPTSISLTTSPIAIDAPIPPGTTSIKTLQLLNNSSQPLKIDMQTDIFSPQGDQGYAIINPPTKQEVETNWVSYSPSSFVAQPGVWANVKMTIALPKSASLGYYYAAVFKPEITVQNSPKTNVIKGSNAIFVLVDTQSSNEVREAQIAGFSVTRKVYEYLPATFKVTIQNSGNIYLTPFGNVYISKRSDLTNTISTLNINAGHGAVLPNSNRVFTANWSDGFPVFQDKQVDNQPVLDKKGNPIAQLHWDFSKANQFRFGKYYAKLTLVYNNGSRIVPVSSEVSFWVIPWKLGLLVLGILLIIGLGFWSLGRMTVRRLKRIKK